ncbi:hypothetical protein GCM10011351_13630 [Paraliobacillus quinghaiensis]|uniref:DUF3231 family protein n=1 Tax=Paraliobacillus quinghaiensis TaxID=470815 RepID=A0A917WU40_9BACI|nr:DUF3231 family protein [Paraliobacillus quinghaiensis]GGM28889.1 hypothetical protein GCM10011351_13630 [Paraliobacillus quinghaiensis]
MRSPKTMSLTSSELGYLWTGYSINEMSTWYLTLFREQSQDEKIKDLYTYALKDAIEIVKERKKLLSYDGYPIPIGFSKTDINESSPTLFSDRFLLFYLHNGTRLGLEFHSRSLASATRVDVRKYHSNCLISAIQLNDKVTNILLNKGLYWRTPTLPAPTSPEYIQKSDYLNGWHGDNRPMNSMELANLYLIIDLLMIIETMCLGFAQTSESDEIAELFLKGVKVAKKQYHALSGLLEKDELPIPPSLSSEITDSKKRVLSDRIMVTHLAGLFGSLLSQYGFSLGTVMKHDLVTTFSTQVAKTGTFLEYITRLLIEKEWLEKVPGAISHKNL